MSEAVKIIEGKTKIVYPAFHDANQVFIESKDTITAGDGARADELPNKGRLATLTTSNVFKLLLQHGIDSHFIGQVSPRRFRAEKMDMIPLEVVSRRYAYGSYLQRNPAMEEGQDLGFLAVELFAKDDSLHDPLVRHDHCSGMITFYDAHQAQGRDSVFQKDLIERSRYGVSEAELHEITELATSTFEVLETAWEEQGYMLVDMKIECGRNSDGRIIIGDVIDNDSWRLWRHGDVSQMVDKQLYRMGRPLDEVAQAYHEVAEATAQF